MSELRFRVIGTPAPQGSKRLVGHAKPKPGQRYGRGIMVESSQAVRPWRQAVAYAATAARGGAPAIDGPVRLDVEFVLPRPASASRKKLALGPCRKPDIDKLLRSTLDGLTEGGVWTDDARVVSVTALKRYALDGESLGAVVALVGVGE